ncbi:MAG TPA: biotin/lipoyl-containing protein [Anaerolineaceae bacterium]|nr:biotin/lipoyl-containing protein [Anaerolineaceae bacterium]
MVNYVPVIMPKVGANDDSGIIVEWVREPGGPVKKGEVICSIETMKSVLDIEAPSDGFCYPLEETGETIQVGDVIAAITAAAIDPQELRQLVAAPAKTTEQAEQIPVTGAPEITLKAKMIAQRHGINLTELPSNGKKITETDILKYAEARRLQKQADAPPQDLIGDVYPSGRVQRILIIGGGDGAVQVLDVLAKTPNQQAVTVLDDNPSLQGKHLNGIPIAGRIDIDQIAEDYQRGEFDAAVISISTLISLRADIFEKLKARGVPFANIIHPSVVKGISVKMGEGNVIMAFTHLGACASLGDNNFISAYCSIEHHNVMGNHCSFGPGVITSSRVTFGDQVRCGTGIFIEPKIDIGAHAVIASGCIIRRNVPEGAILKTKPNYMERLQS